MTHTALTVRALVIGEALAVQVVAMREQRIGARAVHAYRPWERWTLTVGDPVPTTNELSPYPTPVGRII